MLVVKSHEKLFNENKILLLTENLLQNEWSDLFRVMKRSILTIDECCLILFPRIDSARTTAAAEEKTTMKTSVNNESNEDNDDGDWEGVEWEAEETAKKKPRLSSSVRDLLQGSIQDTLVRENI
jgi:hypothetical protein